MKKSISMLLAALMLTGALSGCGGSSSSDSSDSQASGNDSGVSGAITVISREDGSGTRGAFIELTGVEEKNDAGEKIDNTTADAEIANKTDVVLTSVAGNEKAIGYISLGALNDTVKAVKVDGAEAAVDNVKAGTYKLSRPFNIATKGEPTGVAKDFINFILSKLEHNSSENYATALYQFYHDERLVEKLIANPISLEHSFYQKYDHCVVSYVPRALPDGKFAICQEHTTDSLQMLLKADYMTALNIGYNIRRCIVCKNYFLVRSGAHVLYCEGSCPLNERFTCRQYGSYEVQKERSRDVPKIKVKITAFNRIRKDYQRGIITEEEMRRLKDTVRDRLFDALSSFDISNEDFERSISSRHLYPLCRVARQAKPRGRPRKTKDGDGA